MVGSAIPPILSGKTPFAKKSTTQEVLFPIMHISRHFFLKPSGHSTDANLAILLE
jgi:hypothetical protein